MLEEMRGILDAGVNLSLVDVAAPLRNTKVKAVNHHNNVALVDLKADTRVAIEDSDVEFTASIMNFGQAKESRFVEVFINGEKDLTRDVMLEDLEPGKLKEHKFSLRFQRRARPGMDITEKDTPEERERKRRLEREQFQIRVTVTKKGKDDDSLIADNIRDTIIELRRKVPILVVDGNKPEYRGNGGDMFHMLSFYAATGVLRGRGAPAGRAGKGRPRPVPRHHPAERRRGARTGHQEAQDLRRERRQPVVLHGRRGQGRPLQHRAVQGRLVPAADRQSALRPAGQRRDARPRKAPAQAHRNAPDQQAAQDPLPQGGQPARPAAGAVRPDVLRPVGQRLLASPAAQQVGPGPAQRRAAHRLAEHRVDRHLQDRAPSS